MLRSIADKMRRIASFIERDYTPFTEEDMEKNKKRLDQSERGGEESSAEESGGNGRDKKKRVRPVVEKTQTGVDEQKTESTAAPEQKASRKQHEHKKKWNETDRKGLMKDYMQEYRSEGKDQTVKVTKPRIKKKV